MMISGFFQWIHDTLMELGEWLFSMAIGLGMLWFFCQVIILFRRLTDKSFNKMCQRSQRLRYAGKLLRVGMTKKEVREVLGEPDSISKFYGYYTWDYSIGGSVIFDEGKVDYWRGFRISLWGLVSYL